MKKLFLSTLVLLSTMTFSHDEGHGPAIKDESLKGGKVSAIIKKSDVNKGRSAKMLYKGELVYESRKASVKLYLYDTNMKPLDLSSFAKKIDAVLFERGQGKNFQLSLDDSGKYYSGERPLNKRVPFNIDVMPKKDGESLFGAFDGLD